MAPWFAYFLFLGGTTFFFFFILCGCPGRVHQNAACLLQGHLIVSGPLACGETTLQLGGSLPNAGRKAPFTWPSYCWRKGKIKRWNPSSKCPAKVADPPPLSADGRPELNPDRIFGPPGPGCNVQLSEMSSKGSELYTQWVRGLIKWQPASKKFNQSNIYHVSLRW